MTFIFFIIALVLIAVLIAMKTAEISRGDGILTRLSLRFDPVIISQASLSLSFVNKKVDELSAFVRLHIPNQSNVLYGKLKHSVGDYREHISETMRGKHDLAGKKPSSLFLWHIDPNNHHDKKK